MEALSFRRMPDKKVKSGKKPGKMLFSTAANDIIFYILKPKPQHMLHILSNNG